MFLSLPLNFPFGEKWEKEGVYILFICLDFKTLCVNILPARVYAHHMCGVPGTRRGQKRALDPVELEL